MLKIPSDNLTCALMPAESHPVYQWLRAGDEIFPAMLAAIDAAGRSVCLEVYTFEDSPLGRRFREALVRARQRGVRVRVLVDAVGSIMLSNHFWDPLRQAGGEARVFNAIGLRRVTIRSHRKLLVCDERVAVDRRIQHLARLRRRRRQKRLVRRGAADRRPAAGEATGVVVR